MQCPLQQQCLSLSRYPDATSLASGAVLAQNALTLKNLCGKVMPTTLLFLTAVSPTTKLGVLNSGLLLLCYLLNQLYNRFGLEIFIYSVDRYKIALKVVSSTRLTF